MSSLSLSTVYKYRYNHAALLPCQLQQLQTYWKSIVSVPSFPAASRIFGSTSFSLGHSWKERAPAPAKTSAIDNCTMPRNEFFV